MPSQIVVPAPTPDGVDFAGFTHYRKRGKARITTTGAIAFPIYDEAGNAFTIAGSSTDPTYIQMATFRIERALVGTNADVLKLGASAADTGSYIVNSAAVASSALAAAAARLAVSPSGFVTLTADVTLGLFLHNGSNTTPGGTLALPGTDTIGFMYIPVEVWYAKRAVATYESQLNTRVTDIKTDVGITW